MIELTKNQIQKMEAQYSIPLYVFNKDEFECNFRELENKFKSIYPYYNICYSYKTNYTPEVCNIVKKLGGYAEVVSDMEYQLAEKLGYEANKIVYNGPHKGKFFEVHLLRGGINNIDNIEEAERICVIADNNPHIALKTGIRVNFDINAEYTSRFGIDIEKLDEVIALLSQHNIRINGLHCHMSRARELKFWKLRAKTMLNIVSEYGMDDLEYISLGSGMSGHMDTELKSQFFEAPSYDEYGIAVVKQFADYYKGKDKRPVLFTEPGTTLISKYVDFIAKVEGIKEIRGNLFVLCNCSFHNLGEICQMKNIPVRLFHNGGEQKEVNNANFVGYTCLEQDVLYRGFSGKIAVGDYVMFGNIGGYSVVNKPPFIQPNCAMISVDKNGDKLIKRSEVWQDIFQTFVI